MNESKFHFFYGGPFSQWYRSKFTIDGIEYNCAEQFMMAMKADLFGDKEAYDKIMKAHDPSTQKATGRKVKNFNADLWNKVSKAFVYRANMAKFSIPYLKTFILETRDAEIVEASPSDCIWGIGLPEGHPDLEDKTKWRGTNWLGEVLMQVRESLRS